MVRVALNGAWCKGSGNGVTARHRPRIAPRARCCAGEWGLRYADEGQRRVDRRCLMVDLMIAIIPTFILIAVLALVFLKRWEAREQQDREQE